MCLRLLRKNNQKTLVSLASPISPPQKADHLRQQVQDLPGAPASADPPGKPDTGPPAPRPRTAPSLDPAHALGLAAPSPGHGPFPTPGLTLPPLPPRSASAPYTPHHGPSLPTTTLTVSEPGPRTASTAPVERARFAAGAVRRLERERPRLSARRPHRSRQPFSPPPSPQTDRSRDPG